MKKFYLLILLLNFQSILICQTPTNSSSVGNISLTAVVDNKQIPSGIADKLKSKLNQISAKNGIGSSQSGRFIITSKINVIQQELTTTSPPYVVTDLEIIYFIGDGIDGLLFSTLSTTSKNIGKTKDLSISACINKINPNDSIFKQFIFEGKSKIINYWKQNCSKYISKATTLANDLTKYAESIYILNEIPFECTDCYNYAMNAIATIYQKQIDNECLKLLQQGKVEWYSGLNYESAVRASEFLKQINPDASCFDDVAKLNEDIAKRLLQIDKREWTYQIKLLEQESAKIESARAIGVAYGKNQPDVVYYNYSNWIN
jgi:hypothetical protein